MLLLLLRPLVSLLQAISIITTDITVIATSCGTMFINTILTNDSMMTVIVINIIFHADDGNHHHKYQYYDYITVLYT